MDPTLLSTVSVLGAGCLAAAILVPFRPLWGVHVWAALLPFQFVFLRERANINFAPADVVAVGLIAALGVHVARTRRWPRLGRGVSVALSMLVPLTLSLVIGLALGTFTSYAVVNKWIGYGFLALTSAAVVAILRGDVAVLRSVLRTFLFAVLASAVMSVATYWLGYTYLWMWPAVQSNRLAGTLLEAPPYGALLLIALSLQAALLLARERVVSPAFDWFNLCVLVHAITLTFSRSVDTGLAGAGLVFLTAPIFLRASAWRPVLTMLAVVVAISAVTIGAAVKRPTAPVFTRPAAAGTQAGVHPGSAPSTREFVDNMFRRSRTTNIRLVQFSEGLKWWTGRPIAGIGLGRFLAESRRWFGQPYQIHNTYIWLLVETGLIGALWFCVFILMVGDDCLAAARSRRRRPWAIGLAAAFASALGFMIGNEGLYQRHLWLVVAAAGVLAARTSNNRFTTREPPSVIQLVTRMNVGGITQQVIVLADELSRTGYAASIATGISGPAEGDRRDVARAAGVPVHTLTFLSNRINPARDLAAFVQLLWLFLRERPDVVHMYMLKARLLGGLAARVAGVPVVVETLHGNVLQGYYGRLGSAGILWAERIAGRLLVDRVIAVTSGQREELLRFGVAPANRLALQLPGMDVSAFRNLEDRQGVLRRQLGVPDGTLVVGTIGRLVPIKGLDVFLEAAAQVARDGARPIRCLIAGDGPLRQPLEAQRDRLGLADGCTFLGEISDIRGFYAACDLVVMSSRNEGAPIVLLEAMAAGKPVVATAVGGVPDMVEDGVSALLVRSDHVDGLAEAMRQLIHDDGRRERIARAAWQRADRFSLGEFSSGTDRLYRELGS